MTVTRDEWDEQCARWRWPDGENFVVYPLSEGRVRVLDERTGVTWQVLKEEVNMDSGVPALYRAAAGDYFKAHEPKPWLEAKPGEAWEMEFINGQRMIGLVTGDGACFVGAGQELTVIRSSAFAAGRRIWPEVS